MSLRLLAERVVVENEAATLGPRPGYAVGGKQPGEAVGLESAPVEYAIFPVNLSNQLILNTVPTLPQELMHFHVDRRAVVFHRRRRRHVATAQEGAGQVDPRQHGRQQAPERHHVAFAVVDYLLWCEAPFP